MIQLSGSVGRTTNREVGLSSQKEPMGFPTPTAHGTAGLPKSMPRATDFDAVRLHAGDELTGGSLLPDFRVKVAELFETG
jgi:hypothetical protein